MSTPILSIHSSNQFTTARDEKKGNERGIKGTKGGSRCEEGVR